MMSMEGRSMKQRSVMQFRRSSSQRQVARYLSKNNLRHVVIRRAHSDQRKRLRECCLKRWWWNNQERACDSRERLNGVGRRREGDLRSGNIENCFDGTKMVNGWDRRL